MAVVRAEDFRASTSAGDPQCLIIAVIALIALRAASAASSSTHRGRYAFDTVAILARPLSM
jgi:hypothetical protein